MIKAENLLLIDIETVPLYSNYNQLNEKLQKLWDKKSQTLDKENTDTAATFSEKAGIYAPVFAIETPNNFFESD